MGDPANQPPARAGLAAASRPDTRWLSFDEIATLHGITHAQAIRLVRRQAWPTREGNIAGQRTAAIPTSWVDRVEAYQAERATNPKPALPPEPIPTPPTHAPIRNLLARTTARAVKAEAALRHLATTQAAAQADWLSERETATAALARANARVQAARTTAASDRLRHEADLRDERARSSNHAAEAQRAMQDYAAELSRAQATMAKDRAALELWAEQTNQRAMADHHDRRDEAERIRTAAAEAYARADKTLALLQTERGRAEAAEARAAQAETTLKQRTGRGFLARWFRA